MPLYLASLNSGSNGNCYYIGNGPDAVLIDAGISCRETVRRMIRLGLSIRNVKAIFISHEHTDHTRGVEVLSHKYGIPVYITGATWRNSRLNLDPQMIKPFTTGMPVHIGDLRVNPFPKRHDASEPHSFTISADHITAGVFTDIGTACEHVIHHLSQCHAAFLEANYDEQMLERGRYPLYLKRRIRGAEGHLSNDQALDLFNTHRSPWMQLLVLSHLSAVNNHPKLVYDLFSRHAKGTKIVVASRYEETEVFCVEECR
ncbi:MAG: MBL fold metallo-hydrolase [Bacteroidales bacterium]|jgi:phosphoribosyl 1,2-cyclic phosphodiesterase|nr:MBL fold metallo-hydrolase [Bacteroidales bacterium]